MSLSLLRLAVSTLKQQLLLAIVLACPFAFAVDGEAGSIEAIALASVAYDKGDHGEAITLARPFADQGHLAAQYLVGAAIANGQRPKGGLPPPVAEEASIWLKKAASQGYVPAMRDMGHLNLLYPASPALQEAAKWYQAAAVQGDAEAQIALGLLQRNPEDAYIAFRIAAKVSNAEQRAFAGSLATATQKRLTSEQVQRSHKVMEDLKLEDRKPLPDEVRQTLSAIERTRSSRTMKQDVGAQQYMASLPQLRFGSLVGRVLELDQVFGALQYTGGGLIGKH